jgi:acetylglutamate kinase
MRKGLVALLTWLAQVLSVDPSIIRAIVAAGDIPVVASVAEDRDGQALNLNADIAAGEIAASLQAEKLILMTDVPGVMRDPSDLSSIVREVHYFVAHITTSVHQHVMCKLF